MDPVKIYPITINYLLGYNNLKVIFSLSAFQEFYPQFVNFKIIVLSHLLCFSCIFPNSQSCGDCVAVKGGLPWVKQPVGLPLLDTPVPTTTTTTPCTNRTNLLFILPPTTHSHHPVFLMDLTFCQQKLLWEYESIRVQFGWLEVKIQCEAVQIVNISLKLNVWTNEREFNYGLFPVDSDDSGCAMILKVSIYLKSNWKTFNFRFNNQNMK